MTDDDNKNTRQPSLPYASPQRKPRVPRYPSEVKQKAVQLMMLGKTPEELSREMNLPPGTLYNWRNHEYGKRGIPPRVMAPQVEEPALAPTEPNPLQVDRLTVLSNTVPALAAEVHRMWELMYVLQEDVTRVHETLANYNLRHPYP